MEFLIGLSVGMHLGKVMADYLERLIKAYGLLDAETIEEIDQIEQIEQTLESVVDALGK